MAVQRLANNIDEEFQVASRQSSDTRYLHRLHCVKLVQAGCDASAVGEWFDRPARTVERWVRQYAEQGGSGLIDKPRAGRPCTINSELTSKLQHDMQRPPAAHGLRGKHWTGVMLRQWLLQRYESELSLRQSQRLLKRLQGESATPPELRVVS